METKIKLYKSGQEESIREIENLLEEGWDLDEVVVTGTEVLFILHKPTEEELEKEAEEVITSVKNVPLDQVDEWIAKGYKVRKLFSKTGVLVQTEGQMRKVTITGRISGLQS